MIRYLKGLLDQIIDKEGSEFRELLELLRSRSELNELKSGYESFKISLDLDRPWTFEFLDKEFHQQISENLGEFDVSKIFAIASSKHNLKPYSSLLNVGENVTKTPEDEGSFLKLLAGMQEKVGRKSLSLRYYGWADRYTLCNSDYSHRTIAILKYLSRHKNFAIIRNIDFIRYQKPSIFNSHETFILNPKENYNYDVTSWLQKRKVETFALNKQEIFIAVPTASRLATLFRDHGQSHGIWKNPFF